MINLSTNLLLIGWAIQFEHSNLPNKQLQQTFNFFQNQATAKFSAADFIQTRMKRTMTTAKRKRRRTTTGWTTNRIPTSIQTPSCPASTRRRKRLSRSAAGIRTGDFSHYNCDFLSCSSWTSVLGSSRFGPTGFF